MAGFKPQTSGVGSNLSTNWAITTAQYFFLSLVYLTLTYSFSYLYLPNSFFLSTTSFSLFIQQMHLHIMDLLHTPMYTYTFSLSFFTHFCCKFMAKPDQVSLVSDLKEWGFKLDFFCLPKSCYQISRLVGQDFFTQLCCLLILNITIHSDRFHFNRLHWILEIQTRGQQTEKVLYFTLWVSMF